jgi:hypothetical protein
MDTGDFLPSASCSVTDLERARPSVEGVGMVALAGLAEEVVRDGKLELLADADAGRFMPVDARTDVPSDRPLPGEASYSRLCRGMLGMGTVGAWVGVPVPERGVSDMVFDWLAAGYGRYGEHARRMLV